MKKQLLFIALILMANVSLSGQSDEDLIRHTIQSYFNGTAYNHIEQIKAAFHPEATLYLENQEGQLLKFSGAEYAALFANNQPGTFGGRYSKLLSIDIEGNLAQVKAEILMPQRQRRYIDIFIVKRIEPGLWQIVSKAANSSAIEG